jgi:two-component system response regulator AlgR
MNAVARQLVIVDDEAPARERLVRLVDELPEWAVADTCANGSDAIERVQALGPSVVLLDIRMPGMSGIEVARHLSALECPPAVVFTTAYDEYALEAFDSQAVGYLLKPVRKERLVGALTQASRLNDGVLRQLGETDRGFAVREHIAARTRDDLKLIPVREIAYFRADQKYVTVRHTDGEELIEESLKSLEEEFAQQFVRIHRSVLVALAHVEALEKQVDGSYRIRLRCSEERLAVARRQLSELKARLTSGR